MGAARARGKWESLEGAEHPVVSVLRQDHANVSIPAELGPCPTGLKSVLGRAREREHRIALHDFSQLP